MKKFWMMCVCVLALAVAAGARADSIPALSYDLTGATVDGYQLTGWVTLNTKGIIDGANIELVDPALNDPHFTQIVSAGGPEGYAPTANFAYISDPGVGQIALKYLTSLDTSGHLDLCILSANDCNAYQASYIHIYNESSLGYKPVDLDAGVLSNPPPSAPAALGITAEPASLALLGTSILGLASLTIKRKRAR